MNARAREIEAAAAMNAAPLIDPLWPALEAEPWRFDLFAVLRRMEAGAAATPRLGRAPRPSLEPLRLGQEPSSSFAPSTLASARRRAGLPPKLQVYSFGLFGPNGPLPLALTEYAHERAIHAGDRALTEFADLFHHRFLLLFYRAWAQAQSTASLDRSEGDDFTRYCASLIGHGLPGQGHADSVPLHARLAHSGHLVRQTRNAEGLARMLGNFFGTGCHIEEHRGDWLPLPCEERSRLGRRLGARLGVDSVAGAAVWDRQHRFRIELGPMPLALYLSVLPGSEGARQVRDWVRGYVGIEFDFDLRLVLRADQVGGTSLGANARLGWTSWLGRAGTHHRGDLVFRPEAPTRPGLHPPTAAARPAASSPQESSA
jgi:type VI secretion system protein ImpH